MWMRQVLFVVAASGVLAACSVASRAPSEVLLGRYAGTLPCADCEGIRVVLDLYEKTADGPPTHYTLERTYLGTQDGDNRFVQVGSWIILRGAVDDPEATIYQLDPGSPGRTQSFLLRGERELVLLDQELREIESALPDTLTRTL